MKLGLLRSIAVFAIMSFALVTVGSNSVSAAPIAGRNIGIACVYNGAGYCPSSPFNITTWNFDVGNSSGVSTFSITAPTISGAGDYYIDVDDYSSDGYYITADVYTSRLVIHFGAADATPGGPISSTVTHGGYLYTMASNHGSLPSDGSSVATFTVTVTTAPTAVNHLAISGVTAPVTGATPVTSVTADSQYTGTVSWSTSPVKFAPAATYTATITLSATADNTFSGVAANSFTVAGATSVTNSSGSGVITAAQTNFINPASFTLYVSINVLVLVIFGGMGSIAGVVFGAVFIQAVSMYLIHTPPSGYQPADLYIYIGALLVVMMIFRPEGLIPAKRRGRSTAHANVQLTEGN